MKTQNWKNTLTKKKPILFFNYGYVGVFVWGVYGCKDGYLWRSRQGISPLGLESEAVLSHWLLMLGTELRSPGRAASTHKCLPSTPAGE